MRVFTVLLFFLLFQAREVINAQKRYNWNEYVKKNGVPIAFLDKGKKWADCTFLQTYIDNKSIVFLGEQSHTVKEFSELKGYLIKFLHQQMGFNVITFESSMNNCFIKNLKKDKISLDELSQSFGIWNTKENLSLFKYINDSMYLAGMDLIPEYKSTYLKQLFWPIDTNAARFAWQTDSLINELYKRYTRDTKLIWKKTFLYKFVTEDSALAFKKKADKMIISIDSTKNYFINNKRLFDISDRDELLILKSIENKKVFVNYLLNNHNFSYRDSTMGQNLKWLAEEFYPQEKMIVWAANAHFYSSGILSSQLSKNTKAKCYRIGIYNRLGTKKKNFTRDAIFVDFAKNAQFNNKVYDNLKNEFDAVILLNL